MKFSLLATAIVALALAGCDKPRQANPESIEGYGTITEEDTTVAEERAAAEKVSETADPSAFDVKNAVQADDEENDAVESAVKSAEGAAAAVEDEFSGKAVLPSHNLDGNGNPITDGKDPTSNPYGQYRSEYSQESINNSYGQYGSKYSNDSPITHTLRTRQRVRQGYYDYLKFTNPSATKDFDGYYDYLKSTNPSATKDSDGYYDHLKF